MQAFDRFAQVTEQLSLGDFVKSYAKFAFAKYRDSENRVVGLDRVLAASLLLGYDAEKEKRLSAKVPVVLKAIGFVCELCKSKFTNPRCVCLQVWMCVHYPRKSGSCCWVCRQCRGGSAPGFVENPLSVPIYCVVCAGS